MNGIAIFDALAKVDEKYINNCLEGLSDGPAKDNAGSPKRVLCPVLIGGLASLVTAAVVLGLVFGLPVLNGDVNKHNDPGKIAETDGPSERDDEERLIELENITLMRTDGQWYLTLNDESSVLDDLNLCRALKQYDSLEELILQIRTGDFSKGELRYIYENFRRDENGIILFDIDDPPLPVFPEQYSVSYVNWFGEGYRVVLSDGEGNVVALNLYPGDSADFTFDPDNYFAELDENDTFTYTDPEIIDGKTVRYGSNNDSATIRKLAISEPSPGVFLVEIYRKSQYDASFREIPDQIRVFQLAADIKCITSVTKPARLFELNELLAFGFERKTNNDKS
ncbi:MAG: hypothetical protein IJS71_07930 [Clostridia bacterium]|nr:hypothetical protein [Clostridia bacterium]